MYLAGKDYFYDNKHIRAQLPTDILSMQQKQVTSQKKAAKVMSWIWKVTMMYENSDETENGSGVVLILRI